MEGDQRLDPVGPAAGASHDRSIRSAVREGEGHHAARLLAGEIDQTPRHYSKTKEDIRLMKPKTLAIAAVALAAAAGSAFAQSEQFIPANFYWVGPYAPGGSGFGGGMIDYFAMLNERDKGINGVRLTWEKCE